MLNESIECIHTMTGDIQPMLLLLLYGAPVNQRMTNTSGMTPLHTACFHYQPDACVLLVSFDADTNILSGDDYNIIDLLIDRPDRNDYRACMMLTHLLDVKSDLDISSCNSRGQTPAILAVNMMVDGDGEDTFNFLCEHGADLSIGEVVTGRTVLPELAQVGLFTYVEKVLKKLSEIPVYSDIKDIEGETPESIARDSVARCAARPEAMYLETGARYLRIADLIHRYSREFAVNNWRKRTRGGLQTDGGHKRTRPGV